jgi:hypothetical protein
LIGILTATHNVNSSNRVADTGVKCKE